MEKTSLIIVVPRHDKLIPNPDSLCEYGEQLWQQQRRPQAWLRRINRQSSEPSW
jgi:hypothetical protein